MSSSDPISDFWLNLNSRFGNFIKRLTCNHFSNLDVLVPCFLCLLLYTAAQLWLQKLFLVFFISNNFFYKQHIAIGT